jgi:photosystem II stability/assembly factor-like uncharacterized protein
MKKQYPLIALLFLMVFSLPLMGQRKAKKKKQEAQTQEAVQEPTLTDVSFKALKWRNIGPYRGGRSNAVSGVVGNDQLYYTGYTGGGLWKTENAGRSWQNISDGWFKTSSVGEIAVSEKDPNVIYVGMGEHAVRGVMTTFGDGVYKSTDAGDTWEHIGLTKTRHIAEIAIHPDNPDVVFVAAQGALHGPSEERGVYRSMDGGKTWEKVLYVDENTGASAVSLDMNNPRILYAATWEHRRLPWQVVSGGPGSALWKSTDGGTTWKKIMNGLPKEVGKMGISVSRANNKVVYAIVEAEKSKAGLYRSDDGGNSWKHLSSDQLITSRSWYYMEVFPDPTDAETVVVLNAPMMISKDGGKNFSRVSVGHGDTHDLWINPENGHNMILGDDGGGEITFDQGETWSTLNNQPTAQFYRVNTDNTFPYKVYGGQQDNSSVVIASRGRGGISEDDWRSGPGCESAYIAFDPDDPTKLIGGCYQGIIGVLDLETNTSKDVRQYPSLKLAYEPKDMKYRYNWNAPIVTSPHDPNTIYHCGNVVFKTTDWGQSWEAISPDLTRDDPEKQGPGGAPFTNEGAGGENYNTIYYLIESPLEKGVIYTGSDCGLVHVTKDGGQNWTNITPPDLPESEIHSIEVSPHDKGTAYITANRYKFNDFSAMAYKTTDYGQSWTPINKGIEEDDFLNVIREDKKVAGMLYGGGERGFYLSVDGGQSWSPFQLNLPVVPITDLIIQDNDLVAATQGRAFWILDDLGALQQSKGDFGDVAMKLIEPKTSVRFPFGGGRRGPSGAVGQNPMSGVILDYYLQEAVPDSVEMTLDILSASGEVIRSYSNQKSEERLPRGASADPVIPAKKGLNRFSWDMRTENFQHVPDVPTYWGSYQGYMVAPGDYKAKLSMGDQSQEVSVQLIADPRQEVSIIEWKDYERTLETVRKKISEVSQSLADVAKIKKQIGIYNELMKDSDMEGAEQIMESGKALMKKLEAWEKNVVEKRWKSTQDVINWPGKLNVEYLELKGTLDGYDPRVTKGAKERLTDLNLKWASQKMDLDKIMKEEVTKYNDMFKQKQVPALITASEK